MERVLLWSIPCHARWLTIIVLGASYALIAFAVRVVPAPLHSRTDVTLGRVQVVRGKVPVRTFHDQSQLDEVQGATSRVALRSS